MRTTNLNVNNATPTVVTGYDSGSASGSMAVDTASGYIEITETGIYLIEATVTFTATWAAGAVQVRISSIDQTLATPSVVAPQMPSYNGSGPTCQTITMPVVTALGAPDNVFVATIDQASGAAKTADTVTLTGVKLIDLP